MTNSIKAFSKLNRSIITVFAITLILSSCGAQEIENSIHPLTHIDHSPKEHYLKFSQLSKVPLKVNSKLDDISFPDKAMVLLTKVLSPEYLTKAEIKELILGISPPANSSNQTKAELDFLLKIQSTRTQNEVKEALRMHKIVYFPIWGYKKDSHLFFELYEIFGNDFDSTDYPKTKRLLHNIMKEMRIAEFTAKNYFLRARPRQLEPNLKPLKIMESSSFASGHTLWAYMQAYLFSELIPNKRSEFLELAYEIGYSREVLGVHYPSDEEASRILAHKILMKVWEKSNFKDDFKKALNEWKSK